MPWTAGQLGEEDGDPLAMRLAKNLRQLGSRHGAMSWLAEYGIKVG